MARKDRGKNTRNCVNEIIDNITEEIVEEQTNGQEAAVQRQWTRHGIMLPVDKAIIQSTVEHNYAASRIFITGECHEDYLGELGAKHLTSINDVYYEHGAGAEPLFVETKHDTIRMTRFDPKFVWGCIHADTLGMLLQDEIDRLGVNMDPWKMDHFDFYQSMIAQIQGRAGVPVLSIPQDTSLESFYQSVYLSCLLLFNKPGYMNVPVAEHFAQPVAADFVSTVTLCKLNTVANNTLDRLTEQYSAIKALTNHELMFIINIYEHERTGLIEWFKATKKEK
jgi:hypothetical protein